MTLPVVFTANGTSGYNLTNSLRFRQSASAYLNRTPASAGNRQTWTWSGWVKRGTLGTYQQIFGAYIGSGTTDTNYFEISFLTDLISITGYSTVYRRSTAVYRDPSAWYHIIVAMDTTQATAANRVKVYVNGSEVTAFGTSNNPTQNTNLGINGAYPHGIGAIPANASYFDGYQTEVNFIDGQALTPSSFGETSATTGVWIPKKYSGTYGTNGFYLPFTDNSALTTSSNVGLGKDFSGNANYWTTNNISITSGSTYDSMTDVPTLTSATAANYCVANPLKKSASATITNGNLDVTHDSNGGEQPATFAVSSGKWYWESSPSSVFGAYGIILTSATPSASSFQNGYHYYGGNGQFYTGTSGVSYGATFTSGDVIGVALDLDTNQITFYKNGTSQGAKSIVAGEYYPDSGAAATNTSYWNFGQRPFAYTPPTGFVRLNTFNLPTPTIGATASNQANKYFNAITYTGNGAASSNTTQNITTTFYPDLTWVKGRDSSFFHRLTSTGLTQPNYLSTNSTDAEGSVNDTISALASTYFQVKAAGTGGTNQSGSTYVGWTWNANSGSTVSNTAGSITSTVSASTTAGFSVVTWVHSSTTSTIGHGLGVAPQFIILKSRTTAYNWDVGCNSIGWGNRLNLNTTDAAYSPAFWNSTAPTSTVFTYAGSGATNGDNMVAYCFTPIAGYSAFGSYTGNGSTDGTFVYTGFRPRFVLWKNITQASQWILLDTARNTYNVANAYLEPNTSDNENTASTVFDMLSNGFKLRNSGGTDFNENANTYIYMAFAESPFKYANAR
jgi:hypothetical protein